MLEHDHSYPILRRSVARYAVLEPTLALDDPLRWAMESASNITMYLYSDGSTRTSERIVQNALSVITRPELRVLVCHRYVMPVPYYIAVGTSGWEAWEQQIQTIGNLSQFPPLAPRRRAR